MITIKLEVDQLPYIEVNTNGATRTFHTSHNELFQLLMDNCVKEEKVRKEYDLPVFETPALPPNTVKYMALPDGKVLLAMEKKAFQYDISYHNTKFNAVPFPNLLFVFLLAPRGDKYVIQQKRLYAFKDKVLRDTTKLYRFPFSHVMLDGSMCFFFLSEVNDLAQMTSFIYNWLSASFTDHYYSSNGEGKNLFKMPLRQIFTQTQGKEFEFDKLVEDGNTVQSLMQSYAKLYYPEFK